MSFSPRGSGNRSRRVRCRGRLCGLVLRWPRRANALASGKDWGRVGRSACAIASASALILGYEGPIHAASGQRVGSTFEEITHEFSFRAWSVAITHWRTHHEGASTAVADGWFRRSSAGRAPPRQRLYPPIAGNGRAGVMDQFDLKPKVRRHAGGGGDAMRRGQSADGHGIGPAAPQARVQIGADEGGVHLFGQHRFAGPGGDFGFEIDPPSVRVQRAARCDRQVLDVKDGPRTGPPVFQKSRGVRLGPGLLRAPQTGASNPCWKSIRISARAASA